MNVSNAPSRFGRLVPKTAFVLFAATLIASATVAFLTGCAPDKIAVRQGDNVLCSLEGYGGTHIACHTELPVEGGYCDCSGIPVRLQCTVTSTQ